MSAVPYERNDYLHNSDVNKRIVDLRNMNDAAFRAWAKEFRQEVTYAWDELGTPVTSGRDVDGILQDFEQLSRFDTSKLEHFDELTGQRDCIISLPIGQSCNQFFPTMLKTLDVKAKSLTGKSIYAYFSDPDREPRFVEKLQQILKHDNFRMFSDPVTPTYSGNLADLAAQISAKTYLTETPGADDYELVLIGRQDANARNCLTVTASQAKAFLSYADRSDGAFYEVRALPKSRRIMDLDKLFRLLFDLNPATNFSPVVAKYLYQRFLGHLPAGQRAIVYDPSAGWGGRLLGALSLYRDRSLHYVGTDPNTDHWMEDEGKTKYEFLAEFFNANVTAPTKATIEIFRDGSEVIQDSTEFQKYRGQIDFVFTSPPYFGAEAYSDDETQSYKKYPTYSDWLTGFLKETLTTSVEWLKPGRWLCWNIADVALGANYMPLQQNTIDILTELGMEYHGYLKMVLSTRPGGNKSTESGVPTTRNFCQVKGQVRKFEPILMFWKPDLA